MKKQHTMKLKFTHFPVIKNAIKRISFKNAYKSSIIHQSFLYASIPAEFTSYAPTFLADINEWARETNKTSRRFFLKSGPKDK